MKMTHVQGADRGKVVLYALSTCVWCDMTKELLKQLGVEHHYIDVDLLDPEDKEKALEVVNAHNPLGTFPVMLINDERCICGFRAQEIADALQ